MDITKKLDSIDLTYFVWYLLPGLNIIGINILLPLTMICPHKVIVILTISNAVAILVAALILGFIVDSLKLYRFSSGYSKASDDFFASIGVLLKTDPETAKERFDVLRHLDDRKNPLLKATITEHSRWVMINQASKSFYLFAFQWLFITCLHFYNRINIHLFGRIDFSGIEFNNYVVWIALDSVIIFLSLYLGKRLSKIAIEHLNMSNGKYINYVGSNKEKLAEYFTPNLT